MHLTEADIILYIENKADNAARDGLEAHIGDCAECANQFAAISQLRHVLEEENTLSIDPHTRQHVEGLVQTERTGFSPGRFFYPPVRIAFAVVALAAIGVVAYLSLHEKPEPLPSQFRSGEPSGTITILEPADGSVLEKGAVTFRWQRAAGEGYRFQLADEAGTPLWTVFVRDTAVVLPTEVVLIDGKTYLWSVQSPLGTRSKRHAFRYGSSP
jgi:hypothetical protein